MEHLQGGGTGNDPSDNMMVGRQWLMGHLPQLVGRLVDSRMPLLATYLAGRHQPGT